MDLAESGVNQKVFINPNNAGVLKLLINAGVKNGKPLFSVCLSLTITLYLSPKARPVEFTPA